MGLFIRFFKRKFIEAVEGIIVILPIYYTSIHRLPVWNWFKMQKGEMKYLYKSDKFKYVPDFFYKIAQNMLYEFDFLDLEILRKKAKVAILKSRAIRLNDKSIKFDSDILQKEIDNEERKLKDLKGFTIDEFIDYIELTFNNIGTQDPFKLTTSRAFSLFQKAKERNENLKSMSSKN